jgi:Putative polyhydroxyalkanoic acid system protein (PHA_gran_rgn)
MRVTVSHTKTVPEVTKIVNDSVDQLLGNVAGAPLKISNVQRAWHGNTMDFSFTGKMGFFSADVRGSVIVDEKNVTIDVELPGILKNFIPEEKVKAQVEGRVRGLLNA